MLDASVARCGALDAMAPIEIPGRLRIEAAAPMNRFVYRGGADAPTVGGCVGLRLGPDEWLIVTPDVRHDEVAHAIASARKDAPYSLVEVSDRQTGLHIDGALAVDMLAVGCPLDLDPAEFPVGTATRTLFAKAEIVLWRRATHEFHLEVARSHAAYVWGLLAEAAREH